MRDGEREIRNKDCGSRTPSCFGCVGKVELLLSLVLYRHFSIHVASSQKKEWMIRNVLFAPVMLMGTVSLISVWVDALQVSTCTSPWTRGKSHNFTLWTKEEHHHHLSLEGSPHCRETLGLAKMQKQGVPEGASSHLLSWWERYSTMKWMVQSRA